MAFKSIVLYPIQPTLYPKKIPLWVLLFYNLDLCSQIWWNMCSPRWQRSLVVGSAGSAHSTASTQPQCADTLRPNTCLRSWTVVKFVEKFVPRQMHSNVTKNLIFLRIIKMIMKWKWIEPFIKWIKYTQFSLNLGEIESKMLKEMTETGILWRCLDCNYTTKFKPVMFQHVESKHTFSSGYSCQFCAKFCPSRNALRCHVSRQHKSNQ